MTRTKILANYFSGIGQQVAHACIYDDGVIVYLAVSEETFDKLKLHLTDRLLEYDRSDDGWCFAAIVSPDDWERSLDDITCEVDPLTFQDNRALDQHYIDWFVEDLLS